MRRAGIALVLVAGLASTSPSHAAGRWLAGDLHAHTTYSHDAYGGPEDDNTEPGEAYTAGHAVGGQFAVAAARGLDFLAITDHNDIRSQADPGFGSAGVVGVPAYENSLEGHAQMLGATRLFDNGDGSSAAVQRLATDLRADGGVFQVNHPAEGSTGFPDDMDWAHGYAVQPDTVEVWNISRLYQPPLPSASSNDDAVRYWEGWLDRGARVAATGGSDNHYLATTAVQGVGQPTTWVWAEQQTADAVLDGMRRGHTFISDQPPALGGPTLVLEADGDGDGSYESIVGDTVAPGSRLQVRATAAQGTLLRVITDGGRQTVGPIPVAASPFVHEVVVPAGTTWARAELFDPDLATERGVACDGLSGTQTTYCRNLLLVRAMTSALYLREPSRRTRGTARIRMPRARCATRPFTATVRGRAIRRVVFRVDGRRLAGMRRRRGFAVRVDPRRLRSGRHRLTASVTFRAAAGTAPRTLRRRFAVCG